MLGQTVGRYRPIERLTAEGAATVYLAEHIRTHQRVALEVIERRSSAGRPDWSRFLQQAEGAMRLSGRQHFAVIHDYDAIDRLAYLAFDHLGGKTLHQLVAALGGKPAEPSLVVGVAKTLSEAIDFAHRQGFTLRNLMPSRLFVAPDGQMVVAAFGVGTCATVTAPDAWGIDALAYLSPELVKGRSVDARSDVYALSVILYELLTGRPPYAAETAVELTEKHVYWPFPLPRQLNPDLPEPVQWTLLKGLAKHPDDRYSSARELMTDLLAGLGANAVSIEAPGQRWLRLRSAEARQDWVEVADLVAELRALATSHGARPPAPTSTSVAMPETTEDANRYGQPVVLGRTAEAAAVVSPTVGEPAEAVAPAAAPYAAEEASTRSARDLAAASATVQSSSTDLPISTHDAPAPSPQVASLPETSLPLEVPAAPARGELAPEATPASSAPATAPFDWSTPFDALPGAAVDVGAVMPAQPTTSPADWKPTTPTQTPGPAELPDLAPVAPDLMAPPVRVEPSGQAPEAAAWPSPRASLAGREQSGPEVPAVPTPFAPPSTVPPIVPVSLPPWERAAQVPVRPDQPAPSGPSVTASVAPPSDAPSSAPFDSDRTAPTAPSRPVASPSTSAHVAATRPAPLTEELDSTPGEPISTSAPDSQRHTLPSESPSTADSSRFTLPSALSNVADAGPAMAAATEAPTSATLAPVAPPAATLVPAAPVEPVPAEESTWVSAPAVATSTADESTPTESAVTAAAGAPPPSVTPWAPPVSPSYQERAADSSAVSVPEPEPIVALPVGPGAAEVAEEWHSTEPPAEAELPAHHPTPTLTAPEPPQTTTAASPPTVASAAAAPGDLASLHRASDSVAATPESRAASGEPVAPPAEPPAQSAAAQPARPFTARLLARAAAAAASSVAQALADEIKSTTSPTPDRVEQSQRSLFDQSQTWTDVGSIPAEPTDLPAEPEGAGEVPTVEPPHVMAAQAVREQPVSEPLEKAQPSSSATHAPVAAVPPSDDYDAEASSTSRSMSDEAPGDPASRAHDVGAPYESPVSSAPAGPPLDSGGPITADYEAELSDAVLPVVPATGPETPSPADLDETSFAVHLDQSSSLVREDPEQTALAVSEPMEAARPESTPAGATSHSSTAGPVELDSPVSPATEPVAAGHLVTGERPAAREAVPERETVESVADLHRRLRGAVALGDWQQVMKLSQLIRTTMLPPTALGGAPEALRAAGSAAATRPSPQQVDAETEADQSPGTVSDRLPAAPLSAPPTSSSAVGVDSTSSNLDQNVVTEPAAVSEAGPGESAAGREPSAVAERVLPPRQPITDDPDVKAFLENLRRRRAEQSASSTLVPSVTLRAPGSASVAGAKPVVEPDRTERGIEDPGADRLESVAPLASPTEADLSEPVDEAVPVDSSPLSPTVRADYAAPMSAIPSPEAVEPPRELGVSRGASELESSPTPVLEAPAGVALAATAEPTSLEPWDRTKRAAASPPTTEQAESAQVADVSDQADITVPPVNTPQPGIVPPPAPTGSDETNRSIIGRLASRLGWKTGPTIARRSTVLRGHVDAVRSAVFSPDGASLLSGSADRTVRLWDLTSGEPRWIAKEHSGIVFSVAFSPDGRFVASGSADQIVRVATASTGDTVWATKGHSSIIWCVTFAPTGHLLATGSVDHQVRLWDVATGQLQRILLGHGDTVTTVAFAPSGAVLASASEDRTICLWDVASGQLIQVLEGHEDTVTSLAFSPDGSSLVSGSEDKTLRVWDPLTATVRQLITGHEDWISSVAYSPDGRLLASASFDRAVWVWNADGQKLWSGEEHSNLVYCVAFSPDGRRLASASADQTIRIWDLDDLVAGPTDETSPTQGSTAGPSGRWGARTGGGLRASGERASGETVEPPLVAFTDSALDARWSSSWTDTVSLDSPLLVVEEAYLAAELVGRSHRPSEWSSTPAAAPATAGPVAPVQAPWVAETQDEFQPAAVAEVPPHLGSSNAVADEWDFTKAPVDVGEVGATMDEDDTAGGDTGRTGIVWEAAAPAEEDASRRWALSTDADTAGADDSNLQTATSWDWETAGSVRDSYSTRFVPASKPPVYDAVDDRDYYAWTPAGDGDHDHYTWKPAGAGTEEGPILDRVEDADAAETRPAAVAAVGFEPSDALPRFGPIADGGQAGESIDEIADSSPDVALLSPAEQLELVRTQVQSLADRIPQLSRTSPPAPVEPEAPSPSTPDDPPPPEPIRLRRRSIIQLPLTERRISATATARCHRVDGPRALPGSTWLADLPRRSPPSVATPPARPAGRRGLASFVKSLAGFDSEPAEQFSAPQPIDITDAIRALKFARDNRTLAAGSANGAIRIWDGPSQHVLWTFGGHRSIVTCLSFSPDGRTLASGGADHEISFWGVQGGQHLWTLEENDGPITAVAFAPDGLSLASGEEDGTIRLWSIAASVVRRLFSGHTAGITALTFAPDGTILASSSRDGTIRLWNTATGNLERALVGHSDWVNDVAFGSDLRTLISVSSDRTVRIWSLQTDACRTLEGHEAPVTGVAALADGSLVASASGDGTIRLWDFQNGDLLRTLRGDDEGITALTASPDTRWLVSGDEDGTLRIWDLESLWEPVNELDLPRASGWSLAARG